MVKNNPAARFPQTAADTILNKELAVYRNASTPPEFIQSTDFVKLRELSLSMTVPTRFVARARAQSARLTFSGRNLKLWSDYEGADPEVNSYGGRNFVRVDAYALPMQRRLSVAMNLEY